LDGERAIIVVSHDNRIFQFANRIAQMEDGRIKQVDDFSSDRGASDATTPENSSQKESPAASPTSLPKIKTLNSSRNPALSGGLS
jgi:hypothetical protein